MAGIVLLAALAVCAVFYYFYNQLNKKFLYFKQQGIPQLETELFYGSARHLLQKKESSGQFYRNAYNKFKKMGVKQGGVYVGEQPVWVPIEPELIKTILIKDFPYFSAHTVPLPPILFFKNIFLQQGEEWKDMRKKLTPTFTTGKMKMMYNIILAKSNQLSDLVGQLTKSGDAAEIKTLLSRYTTDIIASCGFGIESNSLKNENEEIFQKGQNIYNDFDSKRQKLQKLKAVLSYLGFKGVARAPTNAFIEIENFFRNIVRNTIEYREKNKIIRKDFIHLMIQLKNKGAVTELINENEDVYQKTVTTEIMSLEDIAGQCLLFFQAGFETSSTTMAFALMELTQYPEIQKKLSQEVREVLKRYDGVMTYDALHEMKYVEMVIQETLRKYPALPTVPRICTKTYTIPGSNSVIKKGTNVEIPIWGLHMDPDNYPNPEKFIPERFSAENKSQIKDFTFLPFGEGPRMCLGLRFGLMQSKAGLAILMKNYNFTLDQRTPYPPKYFVNGRLNGIVDGGIWLKASKVN